MCSSLLVKEGILRVHPDLAGRHAEAGQLTSESTGGFISECIFTSVNLSIRLTNDSKCRIFSAFRILFLGQIGCLLCDGF